VQEVLEACRLTDRFNTWPEEDRATALLACANSAAAALRECEMKRALLEAWIEDAP
jgi:hypothetical protein